MQEADIRITLHSRGGFSVYGSGSYDPKNNEAIVYTREGETVALTIDYPSAPTNLTKTEDGISATTPSISGTKAITTLSGITENGTIQFTATVGGETRIVRVRARNRAPLDGYDAG